jgi:hypothetical protein
VKLVASGKTDAVRLPSAVTVLALLVYAAAMTAYIYGFVHRPDADYAQEVGADEAVIFASVALLHVVLGFVISQAPFPASKSTALRVRRAWRAQPACFLRNRKCAWYQALFRPRRKLQPARAALGNRTRRPGAGHVSKSSLVRPRRVFHSISTASSPAARGFHMVAGRHEPARPAKDCTNRRGETLPSALNMQRTVCSHSWKGGPFR